MEHYVVRLWTPAATVGDAPETDAGMHGVVSHVPTGRTETFRDGRELLMRLIDLRGPTTIQQRPFDPAS
jgi:hypothetical protein